jgi:hypothetical protein
VLIIVANRLCELDSKFDVWDRRLPSELPASRWGLKLEQMYNAIYVL